MQCNAMKIARTVTTKALHPNQQMHKQTMTKLIMEKSAEREIETHTLAHPQISTLIHMLIFKALWSSEQTLKLIVPTKVSHTFSFSNGNNSYVKLFHIFSSFCCAQWIQNIQSHTNLIATAITIIIATSHHNRTQNTKHNTPTYKNSLTRNSHPITRYLYIQWSSSSWNRWYVDENIREKLNFKSIF